MRTDRLSQVCSGTFCNLSGRVLPRGRDATDPRQATARDSRQLRDSSFATAPRQPTGRDATARDSRQVRDSSGRDRSRQLRAATRHLCQSERSTKAHSRQVCELTEMGCRGPVAQPSPGPPRAWDIIGFLTVAGAAGAAVTIAPLQFGGVGTLQARNCPHSKEAVFLFTTL